MFDKYRCVSGLEKNEVLFKKFLKFKFYVGGQGDIRTTFYFYPCIRCLISLGIPSSLHKLLSTYVSKYLTSTIPGMSNT